MGGPSVNLKFLQDIQADRKEKGLPQLINIGTCGLHSIHGAFRTGIEKCWWKLKATMKACYTMLHNSPARRDDYISINQGLSPKYPLSFCATRWIEDKLVADRLIELWPCMDFWMKLPKSKQPSNKSYEVLTTSIKDKLMIAKLGFFSYLADMFKPFLTAYQTDNPMVPFMYDDLFRLFKNVLSVIIKPDIINNCDTASKLNDIDLYKSEDHLSHGQAAGERSFSLGNSFIVDIYIYIYLKNQLEIRN